MAQQPLLSDAIKNGVTKVYMAGKMSSQNTKLLRLTRLPDEYADMRPEAHMTLSCYKCNKCNHTPFIYVGPYMTRCDHGCFHQEKHIAGNEMPGRCGSLTGAPLPTVVATCMSQIASCDVFLARIDARDLWGTMAEVVVAVREKKRIILDITPGFIPEIWFMAQMTLADELLPRKEDLLLLDKFIEFVPPQFRISPHAYKRYMTFMMQNPERAERVERAAASAAAAASDGPRPPLPKRRRLSASDSSPQPQKPAAPVPKKRDDEEYPFDYSLLDCHYG